MMLHHTPAMSCIDCSHFSIVHSVVFALPVVPLKVLTTRIGTVQGPHQPLGEEAHRPPFPQLYTQLTPKRADIIRYFLLAAKTHSILLWIFSSVP